MRPIQRFSIVAKSKSDPGGPIDITIDGKPISDFINDYVLSKTRSPWPEKSKVLIGKPALKEKGIMNGSMDLLLCANCSQAGFPSCRDLGLKPIEIAVNEKTIAWKIVWQDWEKSLAERPLTLTFDRLEYQRELEKIKP